MTGPHTFVFTEDNFQSEALDTAGVVLVDFWAEWCPPCRALSPIIDQLASDFAGRARIGKLDVDAESGIAGTYAVSSIPTLLIFKDGNLVDRITGLVSAADLAQRLETLTNVGAGA